MQFQACAYCNHPNPVGTNYCNDCGATLRLKPCQECGAVAGAAVQDCPACSAPFPARPIVDVDIAWAPSAGASARSPRALSHSTAMSEAQRLATVTRALAETREVIEKASVGVCSIDTYSWATQDDGGARRIPSSDLGDRPATGLVRNRPVTAASPIASSWPGKPPAARSAPRQSAFLRFGPMVFITLLGLVAAVALLHLVRFAGESTFTSDREISAPFKTLIRSSPQVLEAVTVATPVESSELRSRLYELPAAATLLELPRDSIDESRPMPPDVVAPSPPTTAPTPATAVAVPARSEAAATLSKQESDQCRSELRALNLCGKVN